MSSIFYTGTFQAGLSSPTCSTSLLSGTPEWPSVAAFDPVDLPLDAGGFSFEDAIVPNLADYPVWDPNPPNPNQFPPPSNGIGLPNILQPGNSFVPQPDIPQPNDVGLSAVPEPSIVALVALGCSAAALSKRFRKNQA